MRSKPDPRSATPTIRRELPIEMLVPDEQNRRIEEDDEFRSLVDSIRVYGVLQPIHVREEDEKTFRILDGERRWRAAIAAGAPSVACDVWPHETHPRDVVVAGVILNEHRAAHGCLHVARRLRQIKNQFGESQEGVATHTGIAIDRVKLYLSLFHASDFLLSFFEESGISLFVAVEFTRFEKTLGEGAARRLAREHSAHPMTVREIAERRRRQDRKSDADTTETSEPKPATRRSIAPAVERALTADAATTEAELRDVFAKHGLKLVRMDA